MFELSKSQNIIPGYTGHIPSTEQNEDVLQLNQAKSHIPGYVGYIPGKNSENLYGQTYGKITFLSSTKQHQIGPELPPQIRYTSTMKDAFKNQKDVKVKDLDRLKIIEEAKKASGQFFGQDPMCYSSIATKSTLPLITGNYEEKKVVFQQNQQSKLTFEQARAAAHNDKK